MTAMHFIEAYPGTLSKDECEAIIARFEADPNKVVSRTQRGVNEKLRTGTMLEIVDRAEWADVSKLVLSKVAANAARYAEKYKSLVPFVQPGRHYLSPPLLEKIEPGQGYNWHIDAGPAGTTHRLISTLLYLRDIDDAGATEFPFQQVAVKPRAGLMVLFPPFWTHLHRGAPPMSETKYNITNYVCLTEEQAAAR